jgi:hypothetical protein
VIDESDLQYENHCDPRILTLLGIKIDWSDESQNIADPICVKREFDSNTIDSSGSRFAPMLNWPAGRCQFRKIIELGIHTPKISVIPSAQSLTVLIEPPSTISRRS